MSAPGYPAPGSAAPGSPSHDPTAVVGTRCLAWLVDILLYVALMAAVSPPFSPLAEKTDVPQGIDAWEDACQEILPETQDAVLCLPIGDTVYWTDDSDQIVQIGVALAWFVLVLVLWQGLKGLTPGKALAGLRVVGEDGQPPGIGRALLRSVLWFIDAIPGIPLVGFLTAASTPGHRRVGDMAAKTYVVRKADAGRPIQVPGVTPSYAMPSPAGMGPGVGPGGYPSPGQGTPAWGGAPQTPATGTAATWPSGPPTAPSGPTVPAGPPTAPQPPVGATPWGAPGAPDAPGAGATPSWGTAPTTPSRQGAEPGARPPAIEHLPVPSDAPATTTAHTERTEAGTASAHAEGNGGGGGREPEPGREQPAKPDQGAEPAGPSSGVSGGTPPSSTEQPGPSHGEPEADTPQAGTEGTATPAGGGPGTAGGGGAAQGEAAQTGHQGYSPQWDPARGTYIQWDPNRNRWLQWDDTAKEWKVL